MSPDDKAEHDIYKSPSILGGGGVLLMAESDIMFDSKKRGCDDNHKSLVPFLEFGNVFIAVALYFCCYENI